MASLGSCIQGVLHGIMAHDAHANGGKGLLSNQEDGAPVAAPGGIMPLSSVGGREPWSNIDPQTQGNDTWAKDYPAVRAISQRTGNPMSNPALQDLFRRSGIDY